MIMYGLYFLTQQILRFLLKFTRDGADDEPYLKKKNEKILGDGKIKQMSLGTKQIITYNMVMWESQCDGVLKIYLHFLNIHSY